MATRILTITIRVSGTPHLQYARSGRQRWSASGRARRSR